MSKFTGPRQSGSRAATLATVLGFGGAFVAQSQRLPLVAVLCLAVGLAAPLGHTREPSMRFRHIWPKRRVWLVGDTFTITAEVSNFGPGSSSSMSMTAAGPGISLPPLVVPQLRPREVLSVHQQVPLQQRRGPVRLTYATVAQHRLVGTGKARPTPATVGAELPAVRPRPLVPPAQLVDLMSRPAEEGYGTGRRGSSDPMSLRQFASGDPVSSVHWRSTARAGVPIVLEREQLASGVLVLLVATSQEGEAWEAAVARAAGLVQAAAQVLVPVQVVVAAPALAPAAGSGHEAVQDWLAALTVAGPPQPQLVERAVHVAAGGLIAVVSGEPRLATAVVEAGVAPASVVNVMTAPW